MKFKKTLKRVGTLVLVVGLMGTTAFAATHKYNFGLLTTECKFTSLCEKTNTSSTAYVTRQTPDSPITTILVTVWNSGAAIKSNSKTITGVGTARPSYSGYNVDKGDYLRLRVCNPSGPNQGKHISAGGTWEP